MTIAQIQDLVTEGIKITAQLSQLKARRDAIAEKLRTYALAHPERHAPLKDEARGGRQVILTGSIGEQLSVLMKDDQIAQTFAHAGKQHLAIEASLQTLTMAITPFYRSKRIWEMVPKDAVQFRAVAQSIIGEKRAPEFISACLRRNKDGVPISDVNVEWEDATTPTPATA